LLSILATSLPVFFVLLTLSCKSSEGSFSASTLTPEVELIPKDTDEVRSVSPAAPATDVSLAQTPIPGAEGCDPAAAPVCPLEEFSNPHRCVALSYSGQLLPEHEQVSAWADSACQAKVALFKMACANNLNYGQLDQISCHPDANEGSCPSEIKDCATKVSPTRCFAKSYDEQALTWTSRPEAWGRNECDARNKLNQKTCSLGLDPAALKTVTCEAEPSSLMCPPIWKNCVADASEFNECTLGKIGEVVLKKPIRAIGTSRCEATYRVQELACRFQKSELKDLGGIECKSMKKQNASAALESPPVRTAPKPEALDTAKAASTASASSNPPAANPAPGL